MSDLSSALVLCIMKAKANGLLFIHSSSLPMDNNIVDHNNNTLTYHPSDLCSFSLIGKGERYAAFIYLFILDVDLLWEGSNLSYARTDISCKV